VPVYDLEPSALVKYYVTEPGSTWVRQLVDEEANVLASAEITIAEVAAALGIIARMGRIRRRQRDAFWGRFTRDLLRRYEFLPTRRTIITRAAALCLKHPLRGLTPSIWQVASSYRTRWRNRKRGITRCPVCTSQAMTVC
jgi:predicted nucleic acid-binding protein